MILISQRMKRSPTKLTIHTYIHTDGQTDRHVHASSRNYDLIFPCGHCHQSKVKRKWVSVDIIYLLYSQVCSTAVIRSYYSKTFSDSQFQRFSKERSGYDKGEKDMFLNFKFGLWTCYYLCYSTLCHPFWLKFCYNARQSWYMLFVSRSVAKIKKYLQFQRQII